MCVLCRKESPFFFIIQKSSIKWIEILFIHFTAHMYLGEELERKDRKKWIIISLFLLFQMKLEKKRASSMDKIMNKLRLAQKKAQEMRSSALANQAHQVTRTSHKVISFRRTGQMGSLSGCFTCHAF